MAGCKFLRAALWTGDGPRLAMAVLFFWTTAVEPVLAQTSPPLVLAQQTPSSGAEQAAPHYSMEDLSYLLEPIALYPDPLLALILSASTFPVQIVEAERWIAFNPISVRRGDFSEADAMDWDSFVNQLGDYLLSDASKAAVLSCLFVGFALHRWVDRASQQLLCLVSEPSRLL